MMDYISKLPCSYKVHPRLFSHEISTLQTTLQQTWQLYCMYGWLAEGDGWHYKEKRHACIVTFLLPASLRMQGGNIITSFQKKVKFRFCNHHLCYVVRAAATEVFVTIGLNVDWLISLFGVEFTVTWCWLHRCHYYIAVLSATTSWLLFFSISWFC